MEKIRNIQELRMQRELLELQQMISELRVKKDVDSIRQRFRLKNNIVPFAATLVKNGIKNNVVRGVFQMASDNLGKIIKQKRKRNRDKFLRK